MKNKGTIVILGGMGPEASARMLEVMVSMATREFGAKECSDFPEIIVDSIPVPDFISSPKNIGLAKIALTERIQKLEAFDPSFFAIACNTAHILFDNLSIKTSVPFISMIAAVTFEVLGNHLDCVGVLATPSTIKSGLYQNALRQVGVKIVIPNSKQLNSLEKVIRNVISGKDTDADCQILAKVALSLKAQGASGIILGCTELPLVFPRKFPMPVFDSIEILSRLLLRKFFEGGDKRE